MAKQSYESRWGHSRTRATSTNQQKNSRRKVALARLEEYIRTGVYVVSNEFDPRVIDKIVMDKIKSERDILLARVR